MSIAVGQTVIVQGMPGVVQQVEAVGQTNLYLVAISVPAQSRWFTAAQVSDGTTVSPAPGPTPGPTPAAQPAPPPPAHPPGPSPRRVG